MIAVSTLRNFTDRAHPYSRNQIRAHESWTQVFETIVYFNSTEQPEMRNGKTRFLPAEEFPRIVDIAEFCANQDQWCCIINADIYVSPAMRRIESALKTKHAWAASSWRHEFNPDVGIDPCERVDNGLDFFAAIPSIWSRVFRDVPDTLRLGCQTWDSWMLGWFAMHAQEGFDDITPSKAIRHPKHEHRNYGPIPPPVHFHGWPVMSAVAIH